MNFSMSIYSGFCSQTVVPLLLDKHRVGWYESGKRKAKALPSKALAEHFRQMKYAQLNSDVFTGTVTVDWSQMREEYSQYKKVKGDKQATLYETALTLR